MATVKIFKLANTESDKYYIGASRLKGSILKIFTDMEYRSKMGVELKINQKLFEFLHGQKLLGSFYVIILKVVELEDMNDLTEFVMDEINDQLELDEELEVEDGLINDQFEEGIYDFDIIQ